jgi:RNA polymerase sigma-70 factor (ECF subfamily)
MPTQLATSTAFEVHRGRLFGLAYRMLGSRAEAEDVVQDAYVRWHQTDQASVRNPEAWLVTTTTRLAIDRLRALKTEREAYKGPWLPEPLMSETPAPDRHVELASDLSVAFMVLLERLAPEERAAFLLHDIFDVSYEDIARILDKSEAACRQTVSRARQRVRRDERRFDVPDEVKAGLLQKFVTAVESHDERALLALFAPDAEWIADGGGRVPAAGRPISGAAQIVKLVFGLMKRAWATVSFEPTVINGEPGLLVRVGGTLTSVMAIDTDGERLHAVYAVVNPEKLPK